MSFFTTPSFIGRYVGKVFGDVKQELSHWSERAAAIPDTLLREQALASIRLKTFHALGGAIFALYPGASRCAFAQDTVRFIVALQTISDYLDNLCDRAGIADEASFRQLHLAMSDAVNPSSSVHNYYRYYPYKDDSHYLTDLVRTCQNLMMRLPSYSAVDTELKKYTRLYSELQIFKHLDIQIREKELMQWAESHLAAYPGLFWWEFAAAAGSTLGMFLLFAAASNPGLNVKEVQLLDGAYFPWIHGLHILLDYFIDSEEDRKMGDLNFVRFYSDADQCQKRMIYFITQSLRGIDFLKYASFHRLVIQGLLAMYLSDPKAFLPQHEQIAHSLLSRGGTTPVFYHKVCLALRKSKIIV